MSNRVAAHFARRSGRRQLLTTFVLTFGGIWLAFEPLGLFFPEDFDWGWKGYFSLLILSLMVAGFRARPRSVVSRDLPPTDVHVEIRVGDLLEQTGNVVVGVPDTFDTQLEDGVISDRSVQGQLLSRVFKGDRQELDHLIGAALPPGGVEDAAKSFGKQRRYPIGTVAVVQRGDARYFLAAFTKMSSDPPPRVESTVEDLHVALAGTWQMIDRAGNREPVHVPIIGSHLARLGLSRTLLIQMIVLSFIASTRRGGPPRLTIYIHAADADQVDMAMLDNWLRGLCAV